MPLVEMRFTNLILYGLHQQSHVARQLCARQPLILPHRSTTKINSVEMQGSQENSADNFFSVKNAPVPNFWLQKAARI
jgi:hypothetical protein